MNPPWDAEPTEPIPPETMAELVARERDCRCGHSARQHRDRLPNIVNDDFCGMCMCPHYAPAEERR